MAKGAFLGIYGALLVSFPSSALRTAVPLSLRVFVMCVHRGLAFLSPGTPAAHRGKWQGRRRNRAIEGNRQRVLDKNLRSRVLFSIVLAMEGRERKHIDGLEIACFRIFDSSPVPATSHLLICPLQIMVPGRKSILSVQA